MSFSSFLVRQSLFVLFLKDTGFGGVQGGVFLAVGGLEAGGFLVWLVLQAF